MDGNYCVLLLINLSKGFGVNDILAKGIQEGVWSEWACAPGAGQAKPGGDGTGLSSGLLDFDIWKARASLFSLNSRISEVDMLASSFLVPREELVWTAIPYERRGSGQSWDVDRNGPLENLERKRRSNGEKGFKLSGKCY